MYFQAWRKILLEKIYIVFCSFVKRLSYLHPYRDDRLDHRHIGETDPSIWRRFASFFYEPTDLSLFFIAITGKHIENDIVIKKKTMNQIKRNEGTRESKTFTRRELQAEHQTGITRQKQNFTALADKSKNETEEAVRLFWTFQAGVGGRRCRSCTRNRARKAKKRRKNWRPPLRSDFDFVVHHHTNCGRYRPLLRSGSGVSAREKIPTDIVRHAEAAGLQTESEFFTFLLR